MARVSLRSFKRLVASLPCSCRSTICRISRSTRSCRRVSGLSFACATTISSYDQRIAIHWQANVQVPFALEDGAIANDVVRTVRQAEEHRHDQAEKEIRRNVIRRGEVVVAAVGITQEDRDQEREDGCDADRDDEVGAVA